MPEKAQALSRSAAAPGTNPWIVAVVVSMATFMEVLDTSVANVSLRHIAGNMAASLDESTWVLTSYLVSNAVILPISGWLSLVIGRKRFYMICVGVFGASSLLCGLAPSLGWLIFFRILQGLGGGGLSPSEQSILADSFTPEQRGQVFALYGIAVVVAPTLGPTLGGWITDNYNWRWIFFINVPVCLCSLFLSWRLLVDPPVVEKDREQAVRHGLRVDGLGFILVALGLGCLQVVLDKGEEDDWFSSDFIIIFAIIAGVSLVCLFIWELFLEEDPIVDLPLLRSRNFSTCLLIMGVTGFILISTTQMLPQFLQEIEGYTATEAGLALTAGGVATLLMMPIVGTLIRKVQPRTLIAIGLAIETASMFYMRGYNDQIDFWHAAWGRVFQAVGLPFLFVPITTLSYSGLPPGKSGNAAALVNTMRNIGGSIGISLVNTVLDKRIQYHHARLSESLSVFSPAIQSRPFPSLAALGRALSGQAEIWAYVEVFGLLAFLAFGSIFLTLLLQKIKPGEAAAHGG